MISEWILDVLDTTPYETWVILNILLVVVSARLALWIDSKPTLLEKPEALPAKPVEDRPLFAPAAVYALDDGQVGHAPS